jgi:predicted permease
MQWLSETYRRLLFLLRRGRIDDDIAEQVAFHLEMETRANVEAGMDADDARAAAVRRFGNALALRERAHDEWGWAWLEGVLLDTRLALRMIRRNPAFAAVAALSLSIGIGLTVATFAVVDAVFLKPIPGVQESRRLVSIYQQTRGGLGNYTSASYPEFEYFREQSRAFDDMAACARYPATLEAAGLAERAAVELVSPTYFGVLGVSAAIGRILTPVDAGQPVAVLNHEFWTRRFGGDPGVVGRSIRVGAEVCTVVGVADSRFRGLEVDDEPPVAWVPVGVWRGAVTSLADDDLPRNWFNQSFGVVARLARGWTLGRAAEDMARVSAQLDADHPERANGWRKAQLPGLADLRVAVFPASASRVLPDSRADLMTFLGLLGAVAALVLAAACVNVAHLLLSRTASRQHELALRLALGARASRLVRQLVTENLVLAAAGATGGLLVARWTTSLLLGFGPGFGARAALDGGLDGRILLAALAAALFSGVVVSLLPLRMMARRTISSQVESRAATAAAGVRWWHQVLVAGQLAVSVVLVVLAGLLIGTLRNARAVDVTARSDEVLLGGLDLADAGYTDVDRGARLYSQLLDRVLALPGVRDAAMVFVVPLGRRRGGTNVELVNPGQPPRFVQVGFNVVTPRYFETVGIPLLAGRVFDVADRPGSVPVAVINEEMASRLYSGRRAIGQRLRLLLPPATTVEIVGIVRDGPFRSFRASMEPTAYLPLAHRYMAGMTLEVRATAGPGTRLVASVRRELAALDPHLPLTNVRTARTHFERTLTRERMMAWLLAVLAVVALVLLGIGNYGTLSYAVVQRTREVGIRVALGAVPRDIILSIVARTLSLAVLGLVAGIGLALLSTRLVRGLLFGVSPTNGVVFAAAISLLMAVSALAAYIPARRAARIDPVVALRWE